MEKLEKPVSAPLNTAGWGSDVVAGLLRAGGYDYVTLTPGASFRGLHDSLVNFLGNRNPQLLLCIHEEVAVAIAHGYAKVTDRPLAVALHSNVGLMHGTMAIFNAWCDRVPMLILGAQGPIDAARRRPWIDWIHTTQDLASLVRGYVKWDDQPGSAGAAVESIARAGLLTKTQPMAPVFVSLPSDWQEEPVPDGLTPLDLRRYAGACEQPVPSAPAMARAVEMIGNARRPILLMGRASRDPEGWEARIRLAEIIGGPVICDRRASAVFPTEHPLHCLGFGPNLSGEAVEALKAADLVLSLDYIDLAGLTKRVWGDQAPSARIIHCSVDQYLHRGWSMDYLGLPSADHLLLATTDAVVPQLLGALGPRQSATPAPGDPRHRRRAAAATPPPPQTHGLSMSSMAEVIVDGLRPHSPSYIRLPIGWPFSRMRFEHPLAYLGIDGGGGLGSGPGMAVGAALALRGSGHLPVSIMGDGEFLMGSTAIWTAVHYRIPLLLIVANNNSFYHDETHQRHMAQVRGRSVENQWIGLRMQDPVLDLAMIARGQGAESFGPIRSRDNLIRALEDAVRGVLDGKTCVLDVHFEPDGANRARP